MRLELLVRRKGTDPTAETCLHALQALMALDVTDLEHGTLWRFDVDGDTGPARLKDAIARAACRAGRYVNTNRDTYAWLDELPAAAMARPALTATDLWICLGDGRDPVAQAYFAAQTGARLRQVRCGMLYRLWMPQRDAAAAREFAFEVAVTRTRRHGLLMNPHAQTLEVLRVWSDAGGEEPGA